MLASFLSPHPHVYLQRVYSEQRCPRVIWGPTGLGSAPKSCSYTCVAGLASWLVKGNVTGHSVQAGAGHTSP